MCYRLNNKILQLLLFRFLFCCCFFFYIQGERSVYCDAIGQLVVAVEACEQNFKKKLLAINCFIIHKHMYTVQAM